MGVDPERDVAGGPVVRAPGAPVPVSVPVPAGHGRRVGGPRTGSPPLPTRCRAAAARAQPCRSGRHTCRAPNGFRPGARGGGAQTRKREWKVSWCVCNHKINYWMKRLTLFECDCLQIATIACNFNRERNETKSKLIDAKRRRQHLIF